MNAPSNNPSPQKFPRWLHHGVRACRRFARRPFLSLIAVGSLSLLLNAGLVCFTGWPVPAVHDEFSYLLAADTFAHGRLANPTHPCWEHFESMHILQQPSHVSKYPPGHGLVLALGQVLTGRPIVGVWMSTVFAVVAVTWMLKRWLPPFWAFLGGMLVAANPMVLVWSYSYWGGAVALAGGAMVCGAWRTAPRRPADAPPPRSAIYQGILLGVGMSLLALSRPYEGLVFSVLIVASIGWQFWKDYRSAGVLHLAWLVMGCAPVVLLTGCWLAYYDYRVTGSPWRMPYAEHARQYAVAPPFLWQAACPEPDYRYPELREFYAVWERHAYEAQRTLAGFFQGAWGKLKLLWQPFWSSFVGPLSLFGLYAARKDVWLRRAIFVSLGFVVALLAETYFQFHYAAPLAGVVLVIILSGLRRLALCKLGNAPLGKLLLLFGLGVCLLGTWKTLENVASRSDWSQQRQRIIESLQSEPGNHVVLVEYGPQHSIHTEWVYNGADIDESRVVWARDRGEGNNGPLLDYFRDRRIWRLRVSAIQVEPHLVEWKRP